MKKEKDSREKRERDLKFSCISGGVIFIAIGLVTAVFHALSAKDGEYGQLVPIFMLSLLAFGVGIFMMFAPREIMKNEADEKNPETRQYAQIMKRRERALKRMREKDKYENKSLKRELFGQQALYAVVVGVIFFPLLGLYFYFELGGDAVLIVVFICIIIALIIYFGYGFGYNSLKKYAESNGIDISAVEEDFRHSSVYSCINSFISIGCIYTVFMSEGHRYIIENKRIVAAAPFYEKVDNFNNGMYSGTTTRCFVILKIEAGGIFKVMCEEFAEELIIEDFKRNQYFMNEKFTVEYPENTPAYMQK